MLTRRRRSASRLDNVSVWTRWIATLAAALVGIASMALAGSSAPAATKCAPGPGVNVSRCDFTNRNLAGKNLRAANFTGAILTGANVTGANLTGAIMTKATIKKTQLASATLKSVQSGGV